MGMNSRPERRNQARASVSIDVEFQVWNAGEGKPLTGKVKGRLTNVSSRGACLQIERPLIEDFHLMRDNDPDGGTPVLLYLPQTAAAPVSVKSQVLWYNRIPPEGEFQFNVGLKFEDLSSAAQKEMEALLRSRPAA